VICSDGVSNSQLKTFVKHEINDFKAAFRHFQIERDVKLTVIVVQKRVTTRLFRPCPSHSRTGQCDVFKCKGEESHHSPAPGKILS
jgi:hypothetical protein